MTLVNGLNRVTKVIDKTHKGLEVPAAGAQSNPLIAVILKWTEGNERIVT